MKAGFRHAAMIAVTGFAMLAAWRIVGLMLAERNAKTSPETALAWRRSDPNALLALAERKIQEGDARGAEELARLLLANEPLEGRAFRVLAAAADKQGRRDDALALYLTAERRAPRDMPTRAWLVQRYLEQGDYAKALERLDLVMRLAPESAAALNPTIVQMAQTPEFADALAGMLRTNPPWRGRMLSALRDPQSGNPEAASSVMQALLDHDALTQEELGKWLNGIMGQGRWGEAYARWAGVVLKQGQRLIPVFNGDFGQVPAGVGFDWRLRTVPGTILSFEPSAGGTPGYMAHLRFLDRQVSSAGLEHPLLLPQGRRYRLSMRVHAQEMRSELGWQWVVACVGEATGVIARTAPIDGSFPWQEMTADFTVPAENCAGQWLRLVNPVPAGAAERTSGDLWVDDVSIQALPSAQATPQDKTAGLANAPGSG